jgi:CRP-like cAMP-binding protein
MKTLGIDLLSELERPELEAISRTFKARSFPKGSVIYRMDDPQNVVFVIRSGRVRVYLAYEEKEFTLAILGKGDTYSSHAGTYVQSLEDTELLVAGVEEVRRALTEVPEFTRTMVRVLGNILKSAFSIIGSLAFKDIYSRLLEFLLEQARDQGKVWDRLEEQTPHCLFCESGLTCSKCVMGPCRINPKGPKKMLGVCGADGDLTVARNFGRFVAAGAAAHSDHGRDLLETLAAIGDGKTTDYGIRDEAKLERICKELGLRPRGCRCANRPRLWPTSSSRITAAAPTTWPSAGAPQKRKDIWERFGMHPARH